MKVDITKLSVGYQDDDHTLLALDQVDLALRPGRVTALVGESGSGKTTLGKALMGLLPENAEIQGSIGFDGQEMVGLDESGLNELRWRRVAMVFQNGVAGLNPVYRLVDQVAEPLIQHRRAEKKVARRQAEEMLHQMGLTAGQGLRYPHELSGGQIQRALLAMALILDPETLILDEPTAALDAMSKSFVSAVVKRLRDKGKSVLLITHDLDLAQSLADELVVLYLGQVMEVMPARDLFSYPQHPYTLALSRSYPGMETVRDLGGIRGDGFYRLVHAHSRNSTEDHTHSHVAAPEMDHDLGHAPGRGCIFRPRCTQAVSDCRSIDIPFIDAQGHRVRCLRGGIVNLIELEGIEKSYGPVKALAPTDLYLRAGEVFCLVGESGSGKTTLASIMAGALDPDHGRRVFDGRNMDDWIKRDYRSLAPMIGFIYQNPAESVSHRFSVFDIVAEPLRIQDGSLTKADIRERVVSALSDVRLSTAPEFLKRWPHELNMGTIQRLCLARALVHNPVFLAADEPTSSLDPSVQAKVLKMLHGLQIEKGLTMLFVTHDIGLARKIADRIGVMLAGKIVEVGPATQIIASPGHPYTRMLISAAKGKAEAPDWNFGSITHEFTGCSFFNRCDRVQEECRLDTPNLIDLDHGQHWARCRHPLTNPADYTTTSGRPDDERLTSNEVIQRRLS